MGQLPSSLFETAELQEGEFQQAAAYCFDAIATFDATAISTESPSTYENGNLRLSLDDWAKAYSLYKVSMVGPCNIERPSSSATMQQGWEAWRALGQLERDEAKRRFVIHVRTVMASAQGASDSSAWPSGDVPELDPLSCLFCGTYGRSGARGAPLPRQIGLDANAAAPSAAAAAEEALAEDQELRELPPRAPPISASAC